MNDFLMESLAIALFTLRYGGLVSMVAGAILWGLSKKSTRNNKRGIWMVYVGAFMFVVYVGWDSFMRFITYFIDVGYMNSP